MNERKREGIGEKREIPLSQKKGLKK